MQSIWAWQILQDLHSNITYINVDESTFTKSTKTGYSWIPKGQSSPIINTWGTGRAVILFALLSSGDFISYISNNKTNSEQFSNFILIVHKFIELWTHIRITQTRILLDNTSIHLSKFSKHVIKRLGLRMVFLPQYSPQLAPVEIVFGMLKIKLSMKRKQKAIRFGSISGKKDFFYTKRLLTDKSTKIVANFYKGGQEVNPFVKKRWDYKFKSVCYSKGSYRRPQSLNWFGSLAHQNSLSGI